MDAANYSETAIIEEKGSHSVIYDLVIIVAIVVFAMCYWVRATWLLNFSLMATYFLCLVVQYKEKRYGVFFFYLTFFLFLLGTIFFGLFDESVKYEFQNEQIEYHVLLCLEIAIVGVSFGSAINKKIRLGLNRRNRFYLQDEYKVNKVFSTGASYKMQSFLRTAFMLCVIFSVIEAVTKAIFVQANSYVAYYSDFRTPLPYFMMWLSSVSPILFYLYLGSLPRKKQVMIPIVMYLLVGVIALFYGQRNVFVVRALVILCYFFLRNKQNDGEIWLSKRELRLIIALIPVGILFMAVWDSVRFNREYTSNGIFRNIINELLTQGNDISILDFEYRYRELLPDKPFAIGGVITLLHNNIVGRIIGLSQIPAQQNTVEIALNGYSFSAALMYVENRAGFLMGYGIGSCYVAELFNSFGFVGIFLGSLLYGIMLKRLGQFQFRGFIANGIAISIFQYLLLAPRAQFDYFISGTFQIANLFIMFICWFLSTKVWPVKEYE